MNLANYRTNILYINFNQDFTCISVGCTDGFKVFNAQPKFAEVFTQQMVGVGICEMLFCSSLVAVVGSGDHPSLSPRKLHIVNTKNNSTICELNFVTPILGVRMNKKRLVVVMETKIHIYDISTMKILHTIDTKPNPKGLCALSPQEENCYLVFPSSAETGNIVIFDALSLQPVSIVNAHKTPLAKLSFNQNGTLLATASNKGTVIRVFNILDPNKIYQFRRGTYPATVHSISFSLDSTLLCVSSDTGTVHIFKTDQSSLSANTMSQKQFNPVSMMSSYLPEMISDMWDTIPARSFATLKLPTGSMENLCTINKNNTMVMAVSADGLFFQYSMDPKVGGELKLSQENSILKSMKPPDDVALSSA